MSLIHKIIELKQDHGLSKHDRLVQGVIGAIDGGVLQIGDKLPSINMMVREIGYARKTIVKAYEELKDRGLVESKKLQGYYIISQETNVTLRVALLLFAFQSFQEDFYNTFRKELGNRYQIDVFFHHNNKSIFETIISNIQGKYGMCVVAPIQDSSITPLLQSISSQKLLLVDRFLFLGPEYCFVSQEFEKATYEKLVDLLPEIQKYKRIVLIDDKASYSPTGIQSAFQRFLSDYGIEGMAEWEHHSGTIEKGVLYFIKSDSTLWRFLKECVEKEYVLGKDLGILSFDDNVMKQIAFGGITTLSTDFNKMAKIAANHIKEGEMVQTILPLNLFRRSSL